MHPLLCRAHAARPAASAARAKPQDQRGAGGRIRWPQLPHCSHSPSLAWCMPDSRRSWPTAAAGRLLGEQLTSVHGGASQQPCPQLCSRGAPQAHTPRRTADHRGLATCAVPRPVGWPGAATDPPSARPPAVLPPLTLTAPCVALQLRQVCVHQGRSPARRPEAAVRQPDRLLRQGTARLGGSAGGWPGGRRQARPVGRALGSRASCGRWAAAH